MHGLLHQLHVMVTDPSSLLTNSGQNAGLSEDRQAAFKEFTDRIQQLKMEMDQSDVKMIETIELMKNASSNPGSQYYWLLFVLMYVGIYLFQ